MPHKDPAIRAAYRLAYYQRNRARIAVKDHAYHLSHREQKAEYDSRLRESRRSDVTTVYGLTEPDGELRYIGKTVGRLEDRTNEHVRKAKYDPSDRSHRANWIRSLLRRGLMFGVMVLRECQGDGCAEERHEIKTAAERGVRLVNLTAGGEGTTGYVPTPETRIRMSAAQRGKKLSPETRAKMSAAQLRRCYGPESPERDAMIAHAKSRLTEQDKKERLAEAARLTHKGRKRSEQTKARMSLAAKTSPKAIAARAARASVQVELMRTANAAKRSAANPLLPFPSDSMH